MKVNLFDTDGVLVTNPENMERSLRRARVSVVDYALANRFDYFGTITFNSKWHDVSNPLACRDVFRAVFSYILMVCRSLSYTCNLSMPEAVCRIAPI